MSSASLGVSGSPPVITLPPVVTSPQEGIPIPVSATGLPAGVSIFSGSAGQSAGMAMPSGVTGLPVGATDYPSSLAEASSSGLPAQAASPAMTYQQSQILIGVTCMLLVLCLAAVAGRFLARRVSRLRLEADDWICVAALLMFIGLCVEQILLAHYGSLILSQMPPSISVLHIFGKAEFASQITYSFVTCAAKVSLLMLYRRIFSLRVKWFRIAWWANVGLVAALLVTLVITNCTQCKPLSALWDNPMSCIPDQISTSSLGFVNAVIDLALLVLPIRMVWSLQMAYKQKIAICGVFSLGFTGVAISLARAIAVANPNFFKGGGLAFILWSTTEPAVGLICSCLPVLRPLYTASRTKLGYSRQRNLYAPTRSTSLKSSAGSSTRYGNESNLKGSTLHSASTVKSMDDKTWPKIMETEIAGPFEMVKSSPVLPADKLLPPTYVLEQEEDPGQHARTWSLTSKSRNAYAAPKIPRSPSARETAPLYTPRNLPRIGNQTIVSSGKTGEGKNFSARLEIHPQVLNEDYAQDGQFGQRHSPSRTVEIPTSRWRSRPETPRDEVESWTSPSLVPTDFLSQRNVLKSKTSADSDGSLTIPSRPQAVVRIESTRSSSPTLRVTTQDNTAPNLASLPRLTSRHTQTDLTHNSRYGIVSQVVAERLRLSRTKSRETMWPLTTPEITWEHAEAATISGRAM